MQEKNAAGSNILQRIDTLKVKTGKTWVNIASDLGISRAMLHWIRQGQYPLNEQASLRLLEAEIQAGLRKPEPRGGKGVLRFLRGRSLREELSVTADQVDSGIAHVPIAYKGGNSPQGCPTGAVELKAPPTSSIASLVVNLLLDDDMEDFVRHFLDPGLTSGDFLNHLKPDSFIDLAEACLILSFGHDWRNDLPKLAKQVDEQLIPRRSNRSDPIRDHPA
jgi:hypothetical protein